MYRKVSEFIAECWKGIFDTDEQKELFIEKFYLLLCDEYGNEKEYLKNLREEDDTLTDDMIVQAMVDIETSCFLEHDYDGLLLSVGVLDNFDLIRNINLQELDES